MKFIPALPILLLFALLTISCGSDQETDGRDIFIGSYTVEEICESNMENYTLSITRSQEDTKIIITGLFQPVTILDASFMDNEILIDEQDVDGFTFSGTGTLSGSILTIDFFIDYDGMVATCNAVCTKN